MANRHRLELKGTMEITKEDAHPSQWGTPNSNTKHLALRLLGVFAKKFY